MQPALLLKSFALLAAGAAIGFALGNALSPPGSPANVGGAPAPVPNAVPGKGTAAVLRGPGLLIALDSALKEPDEHKRIRTLRRLLDGIEPQDIPKALERLITIGKVGIDLTLIESDLLRDWATADPKAALAFTEKFEGRLYSGAMADVAMSWFKKDQAAAQAWLQSLPRGKRRNAAELGVVIALASGNPAQALEMLQANPALGDLGGWSSLFQTVAARDPREAVELALSLPQGKNRTDTITTLVSAWGSEDPQAALSWVKELPPSPLRQQALQDVLSALAWKNPAAAAKATLEETPPGWEQKGLISKALTAWMQTDAEAARAWVEKLPEGELRGLGLRSVARLWARNDPKEAMRYAMRTPDAALREAMIGNVLAEWLCGDAGDAKGGLQWLDENASIVRPDTLSTVFNELSSLRTTPSPVLAAPLLARMPEGDLRNSSARNLAVWWARSDSVAANAWYEQMPEGPAREQFLRGIISGMARVDPAGASEKVGLLPEGAARDQAAAELAAEWARQDVEAADDWLKTLPAGRLRDGAIRQFSTGAVSNDPKSAALWTIRINDANTRRRALTDVVHRWLADDKEAARAWVTAAAIPPEWKASLIGK